MVIFDNVTVTGKVGIGISNPAEKLEVDGKVKATEFVGKGSEITDLNGENITAGIIDDSRIPQTITRESRFDPAEGHNHTGTQGDGPRVSHSNLSDILQVDPSSDDNDLTKHVSDALAKAWQEHSSNFNNPHGTTVEQLLNVRIVQFDFTDNSPDGLQSPQTIGFIPKLILISGGYNVLLSDGSSYGSVVSGFWTKAQGNICSTFEVKKSNNIETIVGVAPLLFSIRGSIVGLSKSSQTLKGTIDFQESMRSLTVKLTKSKQPIDDPRNELTVNVSLMMLCIG